ncbi:MAG: glycosyltransferase [Solirubrobacterales bacterium]|nr:glycosyltransferase [Solirubrobacterales bacterium]
MDDAVRTAMDAGLPYSGLRDFTVDARMWHYIPYRTALELRVVPMTLVGDRLQVVSAVPSPDLRRVLAHFPALRIDVVIAPAAEIDRVLAGVHGTEA